jgi:uncharacterized FAD-dependent dehydrogenase
MGGAGLFSDGKFSFYPSSSILWKKLDENLDTLNTSYKAITSVLASQGEPFIVDTKDLNRIESS